MNSKTVATATNPLKLDLINVAIKDNMISPLTPLQMNYQEDPNLPRISSLFETFISSLCTLHFLAHITADLFFILQFLFLNKRLSCNYKSWSNMITAGENDSRVKDHCKPPTWRPLWYVKRWRFHGVFCMHLFIRWCLLWSRSLSYCN